MSTFDYRRKLTRDDWVRVAGIGAGAGLAVGLATAYLARIFAQRVPLRPAHRPPAGPAPRP